MAVDRRRQYILIKIISRNKIISMYFIKDSWPWCPRDYLGYPCLFPFSLPIFFGVKEKTDA